MMNYMAKNIATRRRQRGMVLITSLMMLVVLTLVAVVAMRSTSTDLRITSNTMLKTRAFEASEGPRVLVAPLLQQHVFYRGWPQSHGGALPASGTFTIPAEVTVVNPTGVNSELWVTNNAQVGDYTPANADLQYRHDGNSDGDFVDQLDVNADIFITKVAVMAAAGSAVAMISGYEGVGKAAAASGSSTYFDVRSVGYSPGGTQSLTGSHYRKVN